jgi:pimeloyl-ACP methyl ester carboxylesterase
MEDDMATATVNGVRLFYEVKGAGDVPLVLVHGSWGSHHNWDLVVPQFARSFRVVTYDRRGHSESERPPGQGSLREDAADLAALIEHLGLGPAWVAGGSFGASITLQLAGERSDLLSGIIAHEPPLFAVLANDSVVAHVLDDVKKKMRPVVERIAAGDYAGAAEQFVDKVALGPGTWARLPADIQQIMISNAPTFLDETRDPEQYALDLSGIRAFRRPALLTLGGESPAIYAPVVAKLADTLPRATTHTFAGAGHIPHVTHASAYVETIMTFVRENSNSMARSRVAGAA